MQVKGGPFGSKLRGSTDQRQVYWINRVNRVEDGLTGSTGSTESIELKMD